MPFRQRQLGDLADRVAVRLEAEPRRVRHREEAVRRHRQVAIDLLVELDREIVVLDQRAVRDAGLQMHVVEAPGAAVRDRHVERRRQARDLQALREAAGDRDIGLHEIDRLVEQQIAEAERQALVLPAGQRHAGRAAQLRHLQRVVLGQRLLEERDAVAA